MMTERNNEVKIGRYKAKTIKDAIKEPNQNDL